VYKFKSFIKQWWGILISIPLIAILLACVIAMTYFRCNNFSISASADSGVVAYADESNSSAGYVVTDTDRLGVYTLSSDIACYRFDFNFSNGYYEIRFRGLEVDQPYTFIFCINDGWQTNFYSFTPILIVASWGERSYFTSIDDNTSFSVLTPVQDTYQFVIDRSIKPNASSSSMTGSIYVLRGSYSSSTDVLFQKFYLNGYSAGYSQGKIDGYAAGTYDEATTPTTWYSYILTIADVPFNLISNMLNFELFGVNIGNFAFAIITGAIVLSLIKLLI
jgi:hypothetical protein